MDLSLVLEQTWGCKKYPCINGSRRSSLDSLEGIRFHPE